MVKTLFLSKFRTTVLEREFTGYNSDYVQLPHLPGGNNGRWSSITFVFTSFILSSEHDT